jgi:transcription-repair coupling factor (superfamily II helicase)
MDQSGHIAAVGYDLYVQLVAEAVAEMKGEPIRVPVELNIDVPSDAHLPADYVAREDLRLEAYRRLAQVVTNDEVDDIRSEWVDRFGPPPPAAEGLLAVARLRVECLRTGVTDVTVTPLRPGQRGPGTSAAAGLAARRLVARISPIELPASARVRLQRLHPDSILKESANQLIIGLSASEDPALQLVSILRDLLPAAEGPRTGEAGMAVATGSIPRL